MCKELTSPPRMRVFIIARNNCDPCARARKEAEQAVSQLRLAGQVKVEYANLDNAGGDRIVREHSISLEKHERKAVPVVIIVADGNELKRLKMPEEGETSQAIDDAAEQLGMERQTQILSRASAASPREHMPRRETVGIGPVTGVKV